MKHKHLTPLLYLAMLLLGTMSIQAQTFNSAYRLTSTPPNGSGTIAHELQGRKVVSDGTHLYAYEIQDKNASGTVDGAILFKMDLSGNVIQSGFIQFPALQSVTVTSMTINAAHTHLFMAGHYYDPTDNRWEALVLRMTVNGTGLYAKTFESTSTTGGDLLWNKITAYTGPSGVSRLALVGTVRDFTPTSGQQIWLAELSETLNLKDHYRFAPAHPAFEVDDVYLRDIEAMGGSTLAIMGVKQQKKALLFRWDPNTNTFMDTYSLGANIKSQDHPVIYEAPPVIEYDATTNTTYLGSYVLAGSSIGSSVGEVMMVARLDNNFNPMWAQEYAVMSGGVASPSLFIGRFAFNQGSTLFGYHVFNLNHNGSLSIDPSSGVPQLCLDHPDLSLSGYNTSFVFQEGSQNFYFGWDDNFGSPFYRVFDTDAMGIPVATTCPPVSMNVLSADLSLGSTLFTYMFTLDDLPNAVTPATMTQQTGENWPCNLAGPLSSFKHEAIASSERATQSSETLEVYPNPATTELTVKLESDLPATISILDLSGRVVLNTSASVNGTVDVSGLNSGLYLLQAKQGGEMHTVRFTKE